MENMNAKQLIRAINKHLKQEVKNAGEYSAFDDNYVQGHANRLLSLCAIQLQDLKSTIKITIEGGCLRDVEGLPEGMTYTLIDRDNCEAGGCEEETCENCNR